MVLVDGATEQKVMHGFVGILASWADGGVSTFHIKEMLVKWCMTGT